MHMDERPRSYAWRSVRVCFVVWVVTCTTAGVGTMLLTLPDTGGEAAAFLYGGLVLGLSGGGTYSLLWYFRESRGLEPPGLARGAVFGLVASVPYLFLEVLGFAASGGWQPAVLWQDLVVVTGCATIGGACAIAKPLWRRVA